MRSTLRGVSLPLQRGRSTGVLVYILPCVGHVFCWSRYSGYPAFLVPLSKRCLQISRLLSSRVLGYLSIGVLGVTGYRDLMVVASSKDLSPFWFPSAFPAPEILDLVGVGRSFYFSSSASRRGTRTSFRCYFGSWPSSQN